METNNKNYQKLTFDSLITRFKFDSNIKMFQIKHDINYYLLGGF